VRTLRSMKTEAPVKLVSFRSQPICMSVRLRLSKGPIRERGPIDWSTMIPRNNHEL